MNIQPLKKENYDTWKIQAKALLIKTGGWAYVNGTKKQPSIVAGDDKSAENAAIWEENDLMAKADLILSVEISQLREIKNCKTSRDVWLKLNKVHESKGPAKAAVPAPKAAASKPVVEKPAAKPVAKGSTSMTSVKSVTKTASKTPVKAGKAGAAAKGKGKPFTKGVKPPAPIKNIFSKPRLNAPAKPSKLAKMKAMQKAKMVQKKVIKGAQGTRIRKMRTSVHFHRPQSVPSRNRMDPYNIIKYLLTTEATMKKIEHNYKKKKAPPGKLIGIYVQGGVLDIEH